jgi:hypothetical protein
MGTDVHEAERRNGKPLDATADTDAAPAPKPERIAVWKKRRYVVFWSGITKTGQDLTLLSLTGTKADRFWVPTDELSWLMPDGRDQERNRWRLDHRGIYDLTCPWCGSPDVQRADVGRVDPDPGGELASVPMGGECGCRFTVSLELVRGHTTLFVTPVRPCPPPPEVVPQDNR